MTITPATYDFVVYRNGDVRQNVVIKVDGVELDLTGWSAHMEVRPALTDAATPIININSTTPTINGSAISFPDAVNGVLQIFIDNLDMTAAFALSKSRSGEHAYVYDLLLTAPGPGDVDPYLAGTFTVRNGVTR